MLESITRNPFYLLELDPGCSDTEIERAGQKIIGMLKLGLKNADTYTAPSGEHARNESDVRQALAELRDSQKRLFFEMLYFPVEARKKDFLFQPPAQSVFRWAGALRAMGYKK